MLLSAAPAARDLARRFADEMDDLAAAFEAHMRHWHSATVIGAGAAALTEQSNSIFNTLSRRNHRENTQLYPVADALP